MAEGTEREPHLNHYVKWGLPDEEPKHAQVWVDGFGVVTISEELLHTLLTDLGWVVDENAE